MEPATDRRILMFFPKMHWFMGSAMSLESLRRNQIGGSLLATFIDLTADFPEAIPPKLDYIQTLNDIAKTLIESLPPIAQFMATPYMDFVIGVDCYLTAMTLITAEGPPPWWAEKYSGCYIQGYW